jgi:hypothetical protein
MNRPGKVPKYSGFTVRPFSFSLISSASPDFACYRCVVSVAHFGGVIGSLVAEVNTAHQLVVVNAVAMVFLFAGYKCNYAGEKNKRSINYLFHRGEILCQWPVYCRSGEFSLIIFEDENIY